MIIPQLNDKNLGGLPIEIINLSELTMIRITLFLVAVLTSLTISAQSPDTVKAPLDYPILKAETYKDGVYMNHDEFLNNTPSNHKKFDLALGSRSGRLNYYDSTSNKYKRYKEPHWGFCFKGVAYVKHQKYYHEIRPTGKYSKFVVEEHSVYSYNSYSGGVVSHGRAVDIDFIIDLTTGEILPLTIKNVDTILLKESIPLLLEFRQEEFKDTVLPRYINEVNKLYSDKL